MTFFHQSWKHEAGMILFRRFCFCFIIMVLSFPAYSEPPDKTHVLKKIIINVDGKTHLSALRAVINIKENDLFSSGEELLNAAERERQDLVNYRVFKYVTMSLDIISEDENTVEWSITYGVKDAFTFFPFIYPKYDSNTGFRLGLKAYYDNAFSTMSSLYLGLGINLGPNKTTGDWSVGAWNINPKWEKIRLGSLLVTVSFLQSYEENQFDSGESSTEYHYGYYRSEIVGGSSIAIPGTLLTYDFSLSFKLKYAYKNYLPTSNYREERMGFGWDHSLSLGSIDWMDNFRHGQSLELNHTVTPLLNPSTEKWYVANSVLLKGNFYRVFGKIFNYYIRGGAFVSFSSQNAGFAENLRGVADNAMSGDWGIYINNSIGIQFWRLQGVWDAQVHPFFDIGIAVPFDGGDLAQDLRYSAGLDFILFLDAIPNLIARGMIGVDLSQYSWDDIRKYEFTITSSLYY